MYQIKVSGWSIKQSNFCSFAAKTYLNLQSQSFSLFKIEEPPETFQLKNKFMTLSFWQKGLILEDQLIGKKTFDLNQIENQNEIQIVNLQNKPIGKVFLSIKRVSNMSIEDIIKGEKNKECIFGNRLMAVSGGIPAVRYSGINLLV